MEVVADFTAGAVTTGAVHFMAEEEAMAEVWQCTAATPAGTKVVGIMVADTAAIMADITGVGTVAITEDGVAATGAIPATAGVDGAGALASV